MAAIKILSPKVSADPPMKQRFVREARTVAGIDQDDQLQRGGQHPRPVLVVWESRTRPFHLRKANG
jgi:hypothetical protein